MYGNFGASIECIPARAKIKINMQKTSFNRVFSLFHQFYPLFHLFIQDVAKKREFCQFLRSFFEKKFFLKFKKK